MNIESGHVFILSGPSGVGKTTFQLELLNTIGEKKVQIIPRYTNRKRRPGEESGFEYNFTSDAGILQKLFANDFIHIERWGDFYQAIETSSISEIIEERKIGIVLASTFGAARLQAEFSDFVTCLYMWTGDKTSLRDPDCLKSDFPQTKELRDRILKKKLEDGFSEFEVKSLDSERFIDKRMVDNNLDIAAINGRLRGQEKVTVLPNYRDDILGTVKEFLDIVENKCGQVFKPLNKKHEDIPF
ncbi:nucleoside-triphosphatase [Pseudoalteromonas maricaloris]|uniref:nucleoside-triphosphatase n=1 Tax=Pseudoalteromonas maricaloris TaxID=184924 RepID=UPI00057E77D3|nr:nucleoside-triphosphatase [Pseudoalteromonas flavipulchra]KID35255.1 hypothetical protein QT15_13415 [Pseudoalteromonas flavipulchra NCIMB 2033 = ATCC BAA-314]MBD0780507.1 hypothetical protein [Pseudoalteromonas flavipulchra]MBE0375291.1 hypothetical protein [Pseudoalteromonas flavipulchra NCIMB 2033 = ATCC BAA-314]